MNYYFGIAQEFSIGNKKFIMVPNHKVLIYEDVGQSQDKQIDYLIIYLHDFTEFIEILFDQDYSCFKKQFIPMKRMKLPTAHQPSIIPIKTNHSII